MPTIDRRTLLSALGVVAGVSMVTRHGNAQEASMVQEPWSVGGLAGTFARPRDGPPRVPAALIIAGSGPTLRDGNVGTLRQIAEGLAAAGVASYRFDKRGIGGSRGPITREDDLVLDSFVEDIVAIVRALEGRPDVSSAVIVGHSEGALIGTLAAAKHNVAGIALLAGPGRNLADILREQLRAIPLPPAQEHFRAESFELLDKLVRGERVANVPPEQAALFRPSVQPFLMSMFAVDPAAALGKLRVPALIVRGASDIQVAHSDFNALAKARPDANAVELPLTNHVFKPAPADLSDRTAQLKSYDPAAPLAPGLMPLLVEFIRSVAR